MGEGRRPASSFAYIEIRFLKLISLLNVKNLVFHSQMMLLLVLCCLLLRNGSPLELEHGFTANDNGENNTWKDVDLNRRIIKDPSYLLDRYPIGESPNISTCRRPAKCVPLSKSICMGTKLPYTFTTLDLIPERVTQDIIEVDKITIYVFFALVMFSVFFPMIKRDLCEHLMHAS